MADITRPLNVAHFPAPGTCQVCGKQTAFTVVDTAACTSAECDPAAATWCLLDALFRQLAARAQDEAQNSRYVP